MMSCWVWLVGPMHGDRCLFYVSFFFQFDLLERSRPRLFVLLQGWQEAAVCSSTLSTCTSSASGPGTLLAAEARKMSVWGIFAKGIRRGAWRPQISWDFGLGHRAPLPFGRRSPTSVRLGHFQKESVGRVDGRDFMGFRARAPGPATFWPPEPKKCPFGPFFKRNP